MHTSENNYKKYVTGIYILFLVICVSLIIYKGNKVKDTFLTEGYGLAKDSEVELTNNREISSVYKASQKNMRGISVRFLSEERFSEEEVCASVYDERTGKLLAEDRVQLKYERIQNKDGGSSIYFSLPIENVKDTELRLTISMVGDTAKAYPSLVLSNSEKNDSQLLIDGEPSNMNLIFSVEYFLGQSRNIAEAVVHGALWIAIGTVLFLFVFFRCGQLQELNYAPRVNRIQEYISEFGKHYGKVIGTVCVALFLALTLICVYKYGVRDAMQSGKFWYFKKMYAVLCLMLLAAATIAYVVCFVKKCTMQKRVLALGLPFGIIFGLVIALNTVPDEPSHIDTAYSLSNELLGIPESDKPGYIYKRAEDVDPFTENKQKLNKQSYKYLYEDLFTKAEDEELVECAVRSNLGNAGKIYYLPQAVGITIGRLLGLGMMPTMLLGRLLSLAAYIGLVYAAVRKLPFGKTTLLLISILPISLQQAASFSYDGMINGVAFLYVSYCLYAAYGKEQLCFSDAAVIAVTGSMICSVKGGVYVALSLLPLLVLLVKSFLSRKHKWIYWAFFAIGAFSFLGKNLIQMLSRFLAVSGTVTGGAASTQIYTFSDVLHAPVKFIGIFLNTFYEQGDKYIRNLFGGNLAWRDINISWLIVFGFILIVLLSCVQSEKERRILGAERCYLGMVTIGAFVCVEVSMLLAWTPVSYDYITGVQGRYFLPFLLLILIACRTSFVKLKKNIDCQLIFGAAILNIMTILQVIQRALE